VQQPRYGFWILALALTWLAAAPGALRAQQAQDIPAQPPSALAPDNLAKPRPAPPFNLTGNWFIDNTPAVQGWLFGPAAIPKLLPDAQKHRDAYLKAAAEG
jgi:hypothetical protein